MIVLLRGWQDLFRNRIRTLTSILVLSVALGLALSMHLVEQTVTQRIASASDAVNPTIETAPVFPSDGSKPTPIRQAQVDEILRLDHVKGISSNIPAMLTPDGQAQGSAGNTLMFGGVNGTTSLASAFDPEANGLPKDFLLPIFADGLRDRVGPMGQSFRLTSGSWFPAGESRKAVISSLLAAKNGLDVGDRFTMFGIEFTISGLVEAGVNDNTGVLVSAETMRKVSGSDEYGALIIRVDDPAVVDAVVKRVGMVLGAGSQVYATANGAAQALQGLQAIRSVSEVGFIVSVGAAALIVFFTLAMSVRQRRQEVGVRKAIGTSAGRIVTQFGVESMLLAGFGSALGLCFTVLSAGWLADGLLRAHAPDASNPDGAGSPVAQPVNSAPVSDRASLGELAVGVDLHTIGLLAALTVVVALIGAAFPTWLIARVRPAVTLRGE